ncbi:MAG: hypothetical protein ACI9W2_005328, partial [Gammaproteobacteria bacterium]
FWPSPLAAWFVAWPVTVATKVQSQGGNFPTSDMREEPFHEDTRMF